MNSTLEQNTNLEMASTDKLRELRKKLVPTRETFLNGKWSPLETLVTKISQQTLESFVTELPDTQEPIQAEFVCGLDGSGHHSKHRNFHNESENIVLGGIRAVKFTHQSKLLYEEESMSDETEFPWFVIPGQEKRNLIKKIAQRMEKEIKSVTKMPITLQIGSKKVIIEITIKVTQCDGKVCKTLTGLGGAFCHMCKTSIEQAQNVKNVKNGFKIERNMTDTKEKYDILIARGEFEKASSKKRDGITQEPLVSDLLKPNHIMPTLHAKLNSLKLFENLAYTYNARFSFPNNVPFRGQGKKKNNQQKDAIKNAKNTFRLQARNGPLSLPLDSPDPTGCGGNTGKLCI